MWKSLLERGKRKKEEKTMTKDLPVEMKKTGRIELLKKAGHMVNITYNGAEDKACFGIGWFFAMDDEFVRLKVTSTRNETYDAMEIEIESITGISDYHIA